MRTATGSAPPSCVTPLEGGHLCGGGLAEVAALAEPRMPRDMAPRIDALATKGVITQDLREWAHQIRLDGNDAVHDEDPFKKEEAEELLDFTELFLTYVYTLPGRLAAKKRPHAPPAGGP